MRIFIFGAGASKGSQPINTQDDYRSPLANELFDEKYRYSSIEMLLSNETMKNYATQVNNYGSIEKWFTKKWEDIDTYKSEQKKRTERSSFGYLTLYVWRLLQRVSSLKQPNKYADFMAKITSSDRDEDIGLISFNYDTLLDQAITEHRKVSLTSLEAYKRENYVKPHGSINWFLGTRSEDPFPPREVTFDRGTRIKFSAQHMFNGPPLDLDKLEMLDANHEDLIRLENLDKLFQRFDPKYFYPLVLVPLLTKLYPHINQLNELIINEGKKLLSQASEIFFIGYQASDEVIFEMLEDIQYGVPLHVIGNKAGSTNQIMKKTLEHPVVQGRLTEGILYSDGFAQFVDSSKF